MIVKWNSKILNMGGIFVSWDGEEKFDVEVRFEFVLE